MSDFNFMQRALELAERGRGAVEPNPLVGAVVVRDGRIVGEGWHQRYAQAHAEVHALTAAGEMARGATLYVTLEPCCHHGKTPPCTDAILRAGIHRVVAAMLDPFPLVAGKGTAQLQEAGVDVEIGIGGPAARSINAPYLKLLRGKTLDSCKMGHDPRWKNCHAYAVSQMDNRGRPASVFMSCAARWMPLSSVGAQWSPTTPLTARPTGPRHRHPHDFHDGKANIALSLPIHPDDHRSAGTDLYPFGGLFSVRSMRSECGLRADRDGCHKLMGVYPFLQCCELGKRRMTNVLVEGGRGFRQVL